MSQASTRCCISLLFELVVIQNLVGEAAGPDSEVLRGGCSENGLIDSQVFPGLSGVLDAARCLDTSLFLEVILEILHGQAHHGEGGEVSAALSLSGGGFDEVCAGQQGQIAELVD